MNRMRVKYRKKLGHVLLIIVLFCWVAVPILPFFKFPYKIIIISSLLIIGEVLFVITIILLGKEYWNKIKNKFLHRFSFKKRQPNQIEETNEEDIHAL